MWKWQPIGSWLCDICNNKRTQTRCDYCGALCCENCRAKDVKNEVCICKRCCRYNNIKTRICIVGSSPVRCVIDSIEEKNEPD
jgi:hypothetical protein